MLVPHPAHRDGVVRLWVNLSQNWAQPKQGGCAGLRGGACRAVQSCQVEAVELARDAQTCPCKARGDSIEYQHGFNLK